MYDKSQLLPWIAIARRHHIRDELFLKWLGQYFVPGLVLEIGAGCGQLSKILMERGYPVIASDNADFFVDYMKQSGIDAIIVDALNIKHCYQESVHNILTQGLSPLVANDLSVVRMTYLSIFEALESGGRLIFIFPTVRRKAQNRYSLLKQHYPLFTEAGFKVVCIRRHQCVPPGLYTMANRHVLNFFDFSIGRLLGIRHIIVLQKP